MRVNRCGKNGVLRERVSVGEAGVRGRGGGPDPLHRGLRHAVLDGLPDHHNQHPGRPLEDAHVLKQRVHRR